VDRRWRIHPKVVDAVVAAALFISVEVQVWSHASVRHALVPALGGLVFCVPVALRRRWAKAGVLTIMAALAIKTLVNTHPDAISKAFGILPALLLVFYGLGAFEPPRRSRWALAVAVIVSNVNTLVTPGKPAVSVIPSTLIILLLPYSVGLIMRTRASREQADRLRAEHLDSVRDLTADAAAAEERTRIARELHDVVAHSVSVMVIQAGGARMVMAADPGRAEESLLLVERAGRDALAEMRRLLGILERGQDPHALAPPPGLANIDELVSEAQAAGLATEFHVEGRPAAVSAALDLCAYRVVQEALTNAIKHVAPARAAVSVRWEDHQLELEISDDGSGPGTALPGGHGLTGMRERVSLHGGTFSAGREGDGGFTVRARLPLVTEMVQ
jgi:signal transduction histidine kinase